MADPARTSAASRRFVSFFQELDRTFVERTDVLCQAALALLSREHLLLTGPPGTAKSWLVASVLGRVLDETTGGPSFYARQFTESTVQTDLIGPINFKTLTETGRTEHFTDEGMLGAVHAFLDEVFDGRDMLLRSALNVLHERELKQGTRITKGKFECAMMASNRYLSEVLEGSRDTLLAFVDRIAFVAFVPRSFAHSEHLARVLRSQIGGTGNPSLSEQLSVQDLDALQHLSDNVHVSDEICVGLAELLSKFDAELNAAVRADPSFVPTRYLSTRTAVRCGRVLRAAVVYDKIFRRPDRALEVMPGDLHALRFHLLLSGPSPEDTEKLLAHETDPRERRQLELLRTEREIFERCFAKLTPISVPVRSSPAPDVNSARKAAEQAAAKGAAPSPKPKESRPAWEDNAVAAIESRDPKRIVQIMPALISLVKASPAHAPRAQVLLDDCVSALRAKALSEGLSFGSETAKTLLGTANEWCALSRSLDGASVPLRSLGRWLRGRALLLLCEHANYSLGTNTSELDELTGKGPRTSQPMEQAQRLVASLESHVKAVREVLAEGVDPEAHEQGSHHLGRALSHAEDELVLLCDSAVREVAKERLSSIAGHDLSGALERMAPEFDRIESLEQRFSALFEKGRPALRERVLGPRIGLLVEASFQRTSASDRIGLSREIQSLMGVLSKAGLAHVIAPQDWLKWTAEALLRAESKELNTIELEKITKTLEPDYEGYRSLRNTGPRIPCSFALAEAALMVSPGQAIQGAPDAGEGFQGIAAIFGALSKELREQIIRFDFGRLENALAYLERWWEFVSNGEPVVLGDESKLPANEQRIRSIVRSKFFTVLFEDSAPARLALEARLLSELFPDEAMRAEALCGRVSRLSEAAHAKTYELFQERARSEWGNLFQG